MHKETMTADAFTATKDRKADLVARFGPLHNTIMERAPSGPSHSTVVTDHCNPQASNQSSLTGASGC